MELSAVVTAFQTGFTGIADDVAQLIGVMIPIALGIAGTIFLVRKAVKWFKSMT
jgi:hypothetical protein